MKKQSKDLRLKEYQDIFYKYPLVLVYHYNTLVYNRTTLEETKESLLSSVEKEYGSNVVSLSIKVVKNTLIKEAIKNTKYKEACSLFTGPTLILYSSDASPKLCDIVYNWRKQYNMLFLLGCKYYDSFLSTQDFDELAKLPNNKGDIVQQVLATLQNPIMVLNSLLSINQNILCNTLELQQQTSKEEN